MARPTSRPGHKPQALREIPLLPMQAEMAREQGVPVLKNYLYGECTVTLGREPAGRNDEYLWHLSIAHNRRYPTWDEQRDVVYAIPELADITMGQLLPPKNRPQDYVNTHHHAFHWWQVDDPRHVEARSR